MEREGTKLERWGYPVRTTSDACITAINSYYFQVLSFGRERSIIRQAPLHDDKCVLANTLAAHFLSSSNPPLAANHLTAAISRLEYAEPYEKAVFDAVSYLMKEDRNDDIAFDLHFKLLREFPRDLLSLSRAQMISFYLGRPDMSLRFVEQVLPQNQDESYVYGMLAFPLLELGRMAEAESAAKKGFEVNKQDVWCQHNLCHVFQNDCRFKEAVEFMEACSSSWASCSSFMYTHNWWHVAVCYLEGHSPLDKILDLYDNHIWKELQRSDAQCGEVYLNALGLLLRAYVRGKMSFIEDRLKTLVNCLIDKSTWHIEWLLDLLTLWALASTGKQDEAQDLLNSMKSRINTMSEKRKKSMQRGKQLAEALYEYGRGNNQRVFDLLGPYFDAYDFKMIGASDEQLDVFNEVWFDVLINTGHISEAIEELEKQIKKREGAPFLWRLLEKSYSMAGREDAAVLAKEKAKVLESAYFEQII